MRAVCVVGLGLIGGSVLRAASEAGRTVWGATASESDAVAARDDGYRVEDTTEDALTRAAQEDALVVVATPITAVREVLRQLAWHAPEAWLTDVVSVKDPVAAEIRSLLPGARYSGGHPMTGTAASGWAAGSSELLAGAPWAVTLDEETGVDSWREAATLALDCGAHVVPTSSGAHDDAVARISHLPHVLAAVLAAVGEEGGPLAMSLAAGSFRDGTRVAASDPELVRAMTEANRGALIDAVDDALGRLGAARGSLSSTGGLKSTVDSGHAARVAWEDVRSATRERLSISLSGTGVSDRLREVGERGGRVVSIDGDSVEAEVPRG